MNDLTIKERKNGAVTVLDLEGKIRLGDDSIKLRSALRDMVNDGKTNILLNLKNISHIDSSGLGEMVAGYVSVKKTGGELKLVHLTDRISELMMITKLLTVFEVYESEDQAVNSFQTVPESPDTERSASVTGETN